jgi:uncharacterized protein YkwD
MHDEDPKAPHYSREGQAAARASHILFTTSPAEHWIDDWLECLYHRDQLLNPDLRSIGVGYTPDRNPDQGWIAVVDVTRGIRR